MSEQESFESLKAKYLEQLKINRELTGQELSVETRHVINVLDAAGDWVFPKTVAAAVNVTPQRAVFLLERLVESGHARSGGPTERDSRYMITQKGRTAVHATSA
jgi:predicted transcriptional regulator